MQTQILSDFWLTSDPIDFEHKKYLLLAYDQKYTKLYEEKKLYPALTNIVDQVKYINDFIKNVKAIENSAKVINRVDWLKKEIVYGTKINDESFNEVKQIAWYGKDILVDLYIRFKNLYDEVDSSIVITGSKISIFNMYSGYIITKYDYGKKEKIWEYEIVKVLFPEPTFVLNIWKPKMKDYYGTRLQKNVFDIIVNEKYPIKDTIIPVIKRKFLLHVLGFGVI